MRVYELLANCDIDAVISKYIVRRNYYDQLSEDDRTVLYTAYSNFLDTLSKIRPVFSNYIIIGVASHNDNNFIEAEMYKKSDVIAYLPTSTPSSMRNRIEQAKTIDLENISELFVDRFPECYSFTFDEWADTLGYEVFLVEDNVDTCSELAEDILWNMSFNGMTAESQAQRREELKKMVVDFETSDKPQIYDGYDMIEELRKRYGIEDIRSEEEREAERRDMYVTLLRDCLVRSGTLVTCKNYLLTR